MEKKYESGIFGRAEIRMGGRVGIMPVTFVGDDGVRRHGISMAELFQDCESAECATQMRMHEPQVQMIFDGVRSLEALENALMSVRELMKRSAEAESNDNGIGNVQELR